MAIFKCKMCGGTIEFEQGATVGVCDSCGTKQTLPNTTDDVMANLHNRANTLRIRCEFDKAEETYGKILESNPDDAEAHWGLILCKYGIEYVEDPQTYERIPTCHRTSFDAILADEEYKSAIRNADGEQKQLYETEARKIDKIQKDILAIVNNEKPFDVFICYKETDENGSRTQDSVIANDVYYQLKQEGFKVFFAAITLEDKLGQEYEPYIFAALNSAKVMLVVGSKPEYFNSVWVKNEWSRFLKLMKTNRGKLLIPCYRDMDAYELPEEFAHLQAQDMSKIGFINDIVRGIKKIVNPQEKKQAKEPVSASAGNANTKPLLERAFLFLEDGKWQDANIYCEKVLDVDPKNAEAYLGKLMAELQVKTRKQLADCAQPFDNKDSYSKVIRFGDEKTVTELRGYIEHINDRNETARLTGIYNNAVNTMNVAGSEEVCKNTAYKFQSISGFKDADTLAEQCLEKAEKLRKERLEKEEADRLEAERKAEEEKIAAEKKKKLIKKAAIIGTPILCVCVAFVIVLNTVIIPSSKYNAAIKLMNDGNIIEAYENLIATNGYKDSAEKASEIYTQYKDEKMKIAEVGDTVFFGSYEQDNDTSNGKEDIEWLVLAKEENKILVISDKALDCQQYNTSYTDVTWKSCSLREWMNGTFLNNAFSAEEQAQIQSTTVSADKNPKYSTTPGNATTDKVFLLSITEVEKYFSSDEDRKCVPTEYAIAQGAHTSSSYKKGGAATCWWWLRSPGYNQDYAAYVFDVGSVYYTGNYVNYDYDCVRPALWINLDS